MTARKKFGKWKVIDSDAGYIHVEKPFKPLVLVGKNMKRVNTKDRNHIKSNAIFWFVFSIGFAICVLENVTEPSFLISAVATFACLVGFFYYLISLFIDDFQQDECTKCQKEEKK